MSEAFIFYWHPSDDLLITDVQGAKGGFVEFTSRLRRHLGESAYLVDLHPKTDRRAHLIDFTKKRRGEEITLIEVGAHGITVEYVASGHKHILTFDEIQMKERMSGRMRPSRKGYHASGTSA
jgi:hypothetical protein